MKKILSLLLALIMCLTVLTACDVQGTVEQVKGAVGPVVDQVKDFVSGLLGNEEEPPAPPTEYHIDKAASYLKNMYKNDNATTAKDYTVVGQVRVAGVVYTVTWSTDVADVKVEPLKDGNYLINVDENATSEYNYVLTATITAGNGDTAKVSFDRIVPEKNLFISVGTPVEGTAYKFFMIQAKADKILYADGTTQNNENKYLNTTQVGKDAPDFFVEKSGEGFKFYYNKGETKMYIKAYLTTEDQTKFSKHLMYTNNADEATVWTYDTATNSWHTSIVQNTLEGDKPVSYVVGTYGDYTTFSISESDYITAENTGVSQFPAGLLPKEVAEMDNSTPEEKVAAELADIVVPSSVKVDGVLDLPLTGARYPEVTMTWTSDSQYAVVGEDGKITITIPAEPVTVKLTVVVVFGEVSETKEFEVELSREATPIADIIALAKTLEDKGDPTVDKYIVSGVIVEIVSTKYGNMYIQDAAGDKIYIYGLYDQADVRYDKMENAPQVGDYITVISVVGHYDKPQLKSAVVLSSVSATTIPEANEIAGTLTDKGDPTADKYLVTGKVVEVASTKYGNMYIEDAEGNKMYIYGLYDVAGNRYDAMTIQPKVGDTITVLSVIGLYNTPQLKNATVVCYTAGVAEEAPHECESVCATCQKCTDKDCTEEVCAEKCQGHETVVHPEGVVDPVVGTPYAFGMVQKNNNSTTYYIKGGIKNFYLDTTEVLADALHVYIEETAGGYHLYCFVDGAKTYINVVKTTGTDGKEHINGVYETTASTVYTYNADSKTLIAVVNDTDYWFGTRNDKTYTTVGPCAVSYKGFYCQFYNVDTTTPEVTPHTCKNVCATCQKCTNKDCTESVCADNRCPGHTTTTPDAQSTTLSFADKAARTELTKTVQVWKSGAVTLTNSKTSDSNDIADYANPARFYQGSEVVIECEGMTSIVFNVNTKDKTTAGLVNALTDTAAYDVTVNGGTVTVTFKAPTNSLTLKATAQFRLNSIVVNH